MLHIRLPLVEQNKTRVFAGKSRTGNFQEKDVYYEFSKLHSHEESHLKFYISKNCFCTVKKKGRGIDKKVCLTISID